jgi:outer membrane protein assembly factor BamB
MGLLSDVPTRPRHPQPRPREGWRGTAAVVLSLLCLAACICLASAVSLASQFPSNLDRYQPTTAGQSSLYRVQYAGGAQGFATTNVVKPSSDALSYVATYAPGRGIQVHNTFTNWQGAGGIHSRDDYFSRNGERMVEVAQLEGGITTLFTPPTVAWSPELLAATRAQPMRGSTTINGARVDYQAWRDPDASFNLPTGQSRPALRLEADLTFSGTLLTHSESWFVSGAGLVRLLQSDGQGRILEGLDLLASTEFPSPAGNGALPLADLLAGTGNQAEFFREDAARTGARPDAQIDPAHLRVTYRLQTGVNTIASPIFANGVFYVADMDGQLAAFDAGQAMPRWQFSAGGPIVAAPAVVGGIVYFGAADKALYAVDAQRGMYLWSKFLKDNVATSPVVAGGIVYVGGEDRTLYALDATTGQMRWTYTTGDRLVSSPAIADGRVIAGSDDGVVYALDAAQGRLLWRYAMDGSVEATPAINPAGTVFVASLGQQLAALDAASGRELWTATTRFGYLASLAWGDPTVAGSGRVLAASTDGEIRAYDAQTGAEDWASPPADGRSFTGSPLVLGRSVLAADTSGQLTVWDATSGVVQNSLELGSAVVSSPTWTGDAVLLTTASGDVITLQSDPKARSLSLTTQWQHEFGGASPDLQIDRIFAQPIWYQDRPYTVLRGGSLWSLDPQTGDSSRLTSFADPVSANPVLSGSVLYVGTDKGRVIAYDLVNDNQAWQALVEGAIRFAPAVSDASVFVNSYSPTHTIVSALARASGQPSWTQTFTSGNSTPVLAGDRLVAAGDAITALDPASGAVVWKSDPFVALGCLASYQGVVYAGRDFGSGPSFVALDGATGTVLWSHTDPVRFSFARPAFDETTQTVIAGATDGELFAYAAKTGEARWRFQADSGIQSDPQVQDGVVYVTATSGNLYAVDVASGRLLTNFRPGTPVDTYAAPLVRPDRIFTAQNLRLFSLALEAR